MSLDEVPSLKVDLAKAPDFPLGGLLVSPSSCRVRAAGRETRVEPRVMEVLIILARAAPRTVSREQLIEACWGGRVVSDDAIARIIAKVRDLARAAEPAPFVLETVPKVGFRLVLPEDGEVAPPAVQPTGALKEERGDAPTLAVLPFTSRSGLAEDQSFADDLVDDLVAVLARGVHTRVLASLVSAGLRQDAASDLPAIGRRLGVRYLLDGNVRRVGDNLRVTAQLLEAGGGTVIGSWRFDRPLDGLAAAQEDLVIEVASVLEAELHLREMQLALDKAGDLTAWEATRRSMAGLRSVAVESLFQAVEEAERAVAIDRNYAPAQAILAAASGVFYFFASPDDPHAVVQIRAMAERALALGPEDPIVIAHVAGALSMIGSAREALPLALRAVQKAPTLGPAHFALGSTYCLLDQPDEALGHLETAARLMPVEYMLCYIRDRQATAMVRAGRRAEAEALVEENLAHNPDYFPARVLRAVLCWLRQDHDRARTLAPVGNGGLPAEQVLTVFRRGYAGSAACDDIQAAIRALWGIG